MSLDKKRCVPCEGGTPPLLKKDIDKYLKELKTPWDVLQSSTLQKHFKFHDFKEGLAFVNEVGKLAEDEGHHPDIYLSWGEVSIELTTHAIGGLSENDFIMARKIEMIYENKGNLRVFI